MNAEHIFPPVLVYVSDRRGLDLAAAILRACGFEADTVQNLADLESMLALAECAVIVTVTAKIGEVRARSNLPIVNIQTFVLPNVEEADGRSQSTFDRIGFVERVRLCGERIVSIRNASGRVVA